MIIDTSALVAIGHKEEGFEPLVDALLSTRGLIPAPVIVEFGRVATRRGSLPSDRAESFLQNLPEQVSVEPFTSEDAHLTFAANQRFGPGNRHGGTLNLLDLMVYAMARRLNLPILCTGRDFAVTDIAIHPASRSW